MSWLSLVPHQISETHCVRMLNCMLRYSSEAQYWLRYLKFRPLISYANQILLLPNEHSSWRYLSWIWSLVKLDHCHIDKKQHKVGMETVEVNPLKNRNYYSCKCLTIFSHLYSCTNKREDLRVSYTFFIGLKMKHEEIHEAH